MTRPWDVDRYARDLLEETIELSAVAEFGRSECADLELARIRSWLRPGAQRLRGARFASVESRFYFIFPVPLRPLRPLERILERWPLGAQYALYARAPGMEDRAA